MRFHIMDSRDICENLATEEYLMKTADLAEPLFLLYIQKPCVIIGRNQNVYEEIHFDYLRQEGITLTRRTSGGGAVYDDLGNVSFSLVMKKGTQVFGDYHEVTKPILHALQRMGATTATMGGRNDLYIEGKKFSGNAMYARQNRTYSHGTLMYDVDLSILEKVLSVPKEKIQSKATPSVQSHVTNLKPYLDTVFQFATTEDFAHALLCQLYQVDTIEEINDCALVLTAEDRVAIEKIKRNRYANSTWVYGEIPDFTWQRRKRFEKVGIVDIQTNIINGKISDLRIFGDFFGEFPIEEFEEKLKGVLFQREAIAAVLCTIEISKYLLNFSTEDFFKLLFEQEPVNV